MVWDKFSFKRKCFYPAWATSICIDAIRRQGLAKTIRMWTTQEPRRCWEKWMEKRSDGWPNIQIVWDLWDSYMKPNQPKMTSYKGNPSKLPYICCLIDSAKKCVFLIKFLMNMVRWWLTFVIFLWLPTLEGPADWKEVISEVSYTVIVAGHMYLKTSSSWWLNQSIWKICSSNWRISPGRGESKIEKWNHHIVII